MADARGFGADINLPVLGKLMIAERFHSRFFEQLANTSAIATNGICKELAALEADLNSSGVVASRKAPSKSQQNEKPTKERESEEKLLTEWKDSEAIRAWAKLSPMLAAIDLRPYIFVAKEKKDYFGAGAGLGTLSNLADKLFGNKLSVQVLENKVRNLSKVDATQIFEAIRSRIIEAANFDTEPAGTQGLTLITKVHPDLQVNLVDLLDGLPSEKLGVWCLKGWDGVIINATQKQRLDRLIDKWSTSGSTILKAAALSAQKIRKKGN
jgi:hypothetical protein